MARLELTDSECRYLLDIVDQWIDGFDEDDVIDDPMHESPDEMLEHLGGARELKEEALAIRQKLLTAVAVQN